MKKLLFIILLLCSISAFSQKSLQFPSAIFDTTGWQFVWKGAMDFVPIDSTQIINGVPVIISGYVSLNDSYVQLNSVTRKRIVAPGDTIQRVDDVKVPLKYILTPVSSFYSSTIFKAFYKRQLRTYFLRKVSQE